MPDVERRRARAENLLISQRNYRRARDRALTRLSNLYPNLYKELLEEEKAKDEAQNNKWRTIGDSSSGLGNRTRAPQKARRFTRKNKGKRR